MYFKDRLKLARKERGLTQKELSEAIYVSRSAVAKWENGLGLPSPASYECLINYLGVSKEDFPLDEQKERIIVSQNIRKAFIKNIIFGCAVLVLSAVPFVLIDATLHGYGFTSKMAAGKVWEDNEVIECRDYDFYISTMDIVNGDSGELIKTEIVDILVVKKRFFGFLKTDISSLKKSVIYQADGEEYGSLYSFLTENESGEEVYYNFLFQSKNFDAENFEGFTMILFSEIEFCGKRIPVMHNAHFITDTPVDKFFINGKELCVK